MQYLNGRLALARGEAGPTWLFGPHHVDGGVWKLESLGCVLVPAHPPHAWHTTGIGRVKHWELGIAKHISTRPAQLASCDEPGSTCVDWRGGLALPKCIGK
jgi:hypothetical protein